MCLRFVQKGSREKVMEVNELQELKMECTGCSNFCGLRVRVKKGEIVQLEGNCCHRAVASVKRQLGISEKIEIK